jgi:hypothetical protein
MKLRYIAAFILIIILSFITFTCYRVQKAPSDKELIESVEALASYGIARSEFENRLKEKFGNLEILKEQVNESKFNGRSLNGEIEIPAYNVLYHLSVSEFFYNLLFTTYGMSVRANYSEENSLLSISINLNKHSF